MTTPRIRTGALLWIDGHLQSAILARAADAEVIRPRLNAEQQKSSRILAAGKPKFTVSGSNLAVRAFHYFRQDPSFAHETLQRRNRAAGGQHPQLR